MTKPQVTRDTLSAALSHAHSGGTVDVMGLLILVGQMLLEFHAETTAQLHDIQHTEKRIMSDLQDIKDAFTAQDAKLDAIGAAVDSLEAAIAGSSAASDAAVAAALADVKAAQGEAQTHVDAVTAKFPTPPAA